MGDRNILLIGVTCRGVGLSITTTDVHGVAKDSTDKITLFTHAIAAALTHGPRAIGLGATRAAITQLARSTGTRGFLRHLREHTSTGTCIGLVITTTLLRAQETTHSIAIAHGPHALALADRVSRTRGDIAIFIAR